jgi:hypothetical protein
MSVFYNVSYEIAEGSLTALERESILATALGFDRLLNHTNPSKR